MQRVLTLQNLVATAKSNFVTVVRSSVCKHFVGAGSQQQRLSGEWKALTRGKKSALELLPVFEALVSEMELSGMGKSDRDLLLTYLALIPPAYRADVLKDRRAYTLADGSPSGLRGVETSPSGLRGVETGREAHRLVVKLEEADSGSKA